MFVKPDLVAVDIAKADSSKTPALGDVWDVINFWTPVVSQNLSI